ncbi:receptor-type tyrosine-protein phosphatase F-like isoform X4 [Varroa destructor]|uniref:protein-tyrosine-phosphatase n=1 Tax=Varroa destructor TaxID=109461 RepID=A0A7M7J1M0_VARDE|nr:receptor-type tyrosine-protein phosphatase F-like isoform X4 [Varroa destructor]
MRLRPPFDGGVARRHEACGRRVPIRPALTHSTLVVAGSGLTSDPRFDAVVPIPTVATGKLVTTSHLRSTAASRRVLANASSSCDSDTEAYDVANLRLCLDIDVLTTTRQYNERSQYMHRRLRYGDVEEYVVKVSKTQQLSKKTINSQNNNTSSRKEKTTCRNKDACAPLLTSKLSTMYRTNTRRLFRWSLIYLLLGVFCSTSEVAASPLRRQTEEFTAADVNDSQLPSNTPQIYVFPKDQTVISNKVASFVCMADGRPAPHIEWRKGGRRVSTTRFSIQNIPGGSVLRIDPVRVAKDNASYECLAENGVGEPVRASFTLYVLEEDNVPRGFPSFSLLPNMQGIERNRSAILPCRAEGDPEPTISWLHNDVPVDLNNPRYQLINGGSLQISNAQEEDQGNYECVAENGVGTQVSPMATLYVKLRRVPPYFSIPPEARYEVSPGGSLNISCTAVGSPMPYVKFRYTDGDDLPPPAGKQQYPEGRNNLTLENIRESVNYTCVAQSKLGTAEHHLAIVVQALPKPPSSVSFSEVTTTSVRLAWSYDAGAENIRYYVVQYKPRGANSAFSEISGVTGSNIYVRDLAPYTEYEFYVIAMNDLGRGSPSDPVIVTTGEAVDMRRQVKPGSAPRNVLARPLSSSTVVVQWDPPKEPNGQVMGYKILYTKNPTLPETAWHEYQVDSSRLTTLSNLTPLATYTITVKAFTGRGMGPASPPIQVKLQQGVPTQPSQLKVTATGATTVQLNWTRPAYSADNIVGYVIYWNDTYSQNEEHKEIGDVETYTLDNLYPDTIYYVWVAARSRAGEGAATPAFPVRTEQYVPGEPRNVKLSPLNSTAISVNWKPPSNRDRHGLIRGFQIHVQEVNKAGDMVGEPLRYDVADENAETFNITDLQPDTEYSIQVAAVTRKGDGMRSRPKTATTHGGVPTKPELKATVKTTEDNKLRVELAWQRPSHTYGELQMYRLRYGPMDGEPLEETTFTHNEYQITVENLSRGARYEFRLAARNLIGWGQEAISRINTPEGEPTAPPYNITFRLQSPDTAVVTWDAPPMAHRNGYIANYMIEFRKRGSDFAGNDRNTSKTRTVFSGLEERTEYVFRIKACTNKGAGPWSKEVIVATPGDIPSEPTNVQAIATSDASFEVWWDEVPYFGDILGYKILYTKTVVEDLDDWDEKVIPYLTWSADITGLERDTVYAVRVAAFQKTSYSDVTIGKLSQQITVRTSPTDVVTQLRASIITTHGFSLSWRPPSRLDYIKFNISYSAQKEFVDSQGVLQELPIPAQNVLLDAGSTNYSIETLMPFTTYKVNVTAIARNGSYRPAAKISVTTAMAAPKPLVKPDSLGPTQNHEILVVLPQASEEFGPIKHYFLVVVPAEMAIKEPDDYRIEDLVNVVNNEEDTAYIAAKFLRLAMPQEFPLGDGKIYGGFRNRKLHTYRRYRIFVRAVVDAPQKNLVTSSPFSQDLGLDVMTHYSRNPTQNPAVQPRPTSHGDVGWIIGPVLIIILLAATLTLFFILAKRRRGFVQSKTPSCNGNGPANNETTMKLLQPNGSRSMGDVAGDYGAGINGAVGADPLELRRMQTPGMQGHPPIPVTELAQHIERLKANDNLAFSQEYESIDPGQQFTWDNSISEINKPKNRYANVIAYDHSRVVLEPLPGIQGSDYINANYCDGYRRQNAYIATQGPLQETIGDFWRMVWEQQSATVVMMTRLEERTRVKCDQYWPSRGSERYGVIEVTLEDVSELATYCVRTLSLRRDGFLEMREIKQLQFTAWPDHGVPDHPTPFLMFLRRVNQLNPQGAGPLIVHCSAGVGRTGCYTVIDSMLQRLRHEDTVDIYGHTTCLRAQRNYMVQTEDQYIFIHDAILEAVMAGHTEVSSHQLYQHVNMLLTQNVDGSTKLEAEFRQLNEMQIHNAKFISANLPMNKFKNRLMNILPYEASRVCLQPLRGADGSDYINASFVDGYRYKNAYIAAQGPMAETTEDFWRMIWEHNSNIIVMLTKLQEMGREKCHAYWPSERSQRYLYYVVDPITEYNMPSYVMREFKVTDARDGQSRTVRQFHFTDWPEQGVPKDAEGYIDLISQVHKTKEQFGQEGPITVHCSAGVGRTGTFIALSIALERLQCESQVDLFSTVRMLRTQRPAMVQTEDQYQFCYRALLDYLSSFDHFTS